MTRMRRREDAGDDEPLDDAADFDCADEQARLRSGKHTRAQMQVVADAIWGSLTDLARRQSYVTVSR